MGSKQLNDEPINMNPVKIQKQIRDNASDVECYLKELNNWSSEMKAKELAESGADLVMQPVENIPLRNDPAKAAGKVSDKGTKNSKNEIENRNTVVKKKATVDYNAWEKFDAEKACEEVEAKYPVKVETEEERIKRRAIEMRLKNLAEEKKNLGNQHLKAKEYDKAIDCYSDAIRCDSKSTVLYANRAQAYIFKKEFQKAVDDCSSSIKNDASNVKAYYRRAKARMELGKLNDAKNDVNQILKLDPSNAEAKQMLRQISGKSLSTLFGPTKPTPPTPSSTTPSPTIRQSYFPGVKTVLGTPKWFSMADDDDEDLYSGAKGDSEKNYPKKILPIRKPAERRSKRPLLPIPVKIVGSQEKRLRLDFNGNSDGNSSNSASISNDSSGLSTPVTCPSSPPSNILTATQSPSSLPTLFSQLNMTSIPPKPKTAASFNSDWKKLKPYSDMSAQYLKQVDEDDYLMFQDSMEYSVLSDILDLLVWEFLPRGWDIISHLKGLLKVRRISTLLMFMTEKDRANARKLISECPEDVQGTLKQQYCI